VSSLGRGDDYLHHHDGSHRWAGGPANMPLPVWHAVIRAHMQQHLEGMGGSTTLADEEQAAREAPPQSTLVDRRVARWIARRVAVEQDL
jgi:hypothetical protein